MRDDRNASPRTLDTLLSVIAGISLTTLLGRGIGWGNDVPAFVFFLIFCGVCFLVCQGMVLWILLSLHTRSGRLKGYAFILALASLTVAWIRFKP